MSKAEDHGRDDPAAPWNRPRKARGKKDRKRWCRGKEGVEHVTAIVKDNWLGGRPCRWFNWYKRVTYADHWESEVAGQRWSCHHVEQCVNCGKKLRHLVDSECPDYVPATQSA